MKVCLFVMTFFFSINAYSIDFEDAIFPELATSGRALAMGNAFISKVDDAAAAFYNPAGLGSIRNTHFHLSNFHMEFNKGLMSAGTGGAITDAAQNSMKMFSLDGVRQILSENVGSIAHARVHALPNFTSRYFSAGYLVAKRSRAAVTDATSSTGFEYADRLDHGPYAAVNLSLFGGVFKAGISAIFLNRSEAIGKTSAASTFNLSGDDYKKGNAFIATAGGKITLPITFLPTFSATMHNAFLQDFQNGRGAGVPDPIKTTVDFGISITPQITNSTRLHIEGNIKDFTQEFSEVTASRRFVVGMELDFSRRFFVRVGYGDGFGSFGLGIKSQKLEFDLTTYAVDTSTATFRGEEDRRFAMSLSTGF